MADLTDLQAAQAVKIVGSDSLGVETNPLSVLPDGHGYIGQKTLISTLNSSTTPLGIGATFTGTSEEVVNYSSITVAVFADQASAVNGLMAQWSEDNTNWDFVSHSTLAIGVPRAFAFPPIARYFRMVYTNGAIAQGAFRLQVTYHYIPVLTVPSQKMNDGIVGDTDAIIVKSAIIGLDPDSGNYVEVQVDDQGRLVTSAITGFGSDFAFGDVTTSATTKAIIRRTAYIEQTSDAQRSIVSSSVNDAAAGTGARTISITYLDSTGAGPFIETITLNGTTPVDTVATNICFIEQMEVLTAGSTLSNVGTITLKAATAGGGATIGTMMPTDNQTFWAHHYIPIGKVCNITGISCGHNGTTVGSGGLFTVSARLIGVTNAIERQVSDFVRLYGQSSTFARAYTSPIKVSGPARLFAYVTPESASSIIYRCSVDFFEP